MKRVLLLIPVLACLSCTTSGTVTSKGYDAAYSGVHIIGGCPCYPYTVPECWRLDLVDGEAGGSVCVDKSTWDQVQIGQYYRDPS